MKIVNLDKFRSAHEVTIGDNTYHVNGIPVGMFVDGSFEEELNAAQTPKEQVKVMLDYLLRLSDIPEDTLKNQEIPVLQALILVTQGIDPCAPTATEEAAKNE